MIKRTKALARLIKKEKERKRQKMSGIKGDIIIDVRENKILLTTSGQNFENFFKNITYQNLTHEIINLKNIIIIKEIKLVVKKKKIPTNKT